jgi:hypothetical protein
MSNSAFALSPIAARAASPTEADFDAIREAFVETARGRWFLDEYTKRNRNADTALVLDAVARIERTIAAQKELKAEELKVEEPQAPSGPDLTETLVAVKAIIAAAKQNAEVALSGPPMDEALAPSRKCARVIREIAWGLREAGADGRICALLDSQVDAINAACDRIPTSGFRDNVLGAFDLAAEQIDQLSASGVTPTETFQAHAETAVGDTRNVSGNVSEEAQNAASNVSNDNHEVLHEVTFSAADAVDIPSLTDASSADTSLTDISLSDVSLIDTMPDAQAAIEQDAAPVEAMDVLTQAPSQVDMQVDLQSDMQPDLAAQADVSEDMSFAEMTAEPVAAVSEQETLPAATAMHSEDILSAELASQDIASEDAASVVLDENLFDLAAESNAQAIGDADATIAVQEEAPVETLKLSAPSDMTPDVMVEAATMPEAALEPMPATETISEAAPVSEAAPEQEQPTSSVAASDDITVVPQVVESLESMADIVIEDTASDEALAEQEAAAYTTAVAAQDLPPVEAPQIVAVAEDAPETALAAEPATPVADVESEAISDMISDTALATPAEAAWGMTLDEAPSAPAKTPLPDNMLSGVSMIAQDSYSVGEMQAIAAAEAAPALMTEHMIGPAAPSMPDAITPPISLGASLIANGIVAKPETPRSDPLAGIRRMSHAERIAFFS